MSQGSLIALYKATFQPPNVLQEKRINYNINYTIFEIIVVTSDPEYHKNNNKQDIKYFLSYLKRQINICTKLLMYNF